MHGARSAAGSVNRPLLPIAINSVLDGFDVPAIARSKISAALTLHSDAARAVGGSLRIAGWQVGIAAFAVGDRVIGRRRLAFESFGLVRRGKGFFFFEFRNLRRVGLGFGRLGGLFFVKTLGGIYCLALRNHGLLGQWNSGGSDQIHFRAAKFAANAAPGIATTIKKRGGEDSHSEGSMKHERINKIVAEGEFLRIGDGGGHFLAW